MDNYIVYEVLYKNKCVYIGSGKPDRYQHVLSGKSSNIELNRLYFTDFENMSVVVIRDGLSKEESLEMEKGYIQASEPEFNKVHTRRNRKSKRPLPLLQ